VSNECTTCGGTGRIPTSRPVMNPPADEAEAGNRANTAPRQADPAAPGRGETGVSSGSEARPVTATEHLSSKTSFEHPVRRWTGPDANNVISEWVTMRASDYDRLSAENRTLRPMAESWESYEAAQERKAAMRPDETSVAPAVYASLFHPNQLQALIQALPIRDGYTQWGRLHGMITRWLQTGDPNTATARPDPECNGNCFQVGGPFISEDPDCPKHGSPEGPRETSGFRCAANRTADPPQDCDWPHCGCDAKATKVIESLLEQGWMPAPLAESHEALADHLKTRHASTQCQVCGKSGLHEHTPTELIIYRNGVKCGRSLYEAPPSTPRLGQCEATVPAQWHTPEHRCQFQATAEAGGQKFCGRHAKGSPLEPAGEPMPHHVRYDRLGWVCSICGGWNDAAGGVACRYPHKSTQNVSKPPPTDYLTELEKDPVMKARLDEIRRRRQVFYPLAQKPSDA